MKEYILNITPMPAPRMHGKRPTKATMRYKTFRETLVWLCREQRLHHVPAAIGFHFEIPMPKSWSFSKQDRMNGSLHQTGNGPDLDNLIKAVLDCLTYGRSLNDSHVATFLFAQKTWSRAGRITLFIPTPEETTFEKLKLWKRP